MDVGLGDGEGEADGDGLGVAVAMGVAVGVTFGEGVGGTIGVGVGSGIGVGVGSGVGLGVGVGVGTRLGDGLGVGVTPGGVGVGGGETENVFSNVHVASRWNGPRASSTVPKPKSWKSASQATPVCSQVPSPANGPISTIR